MPNEKQTKLIAAKMSNEIQTDLAAAKTQELPALASNVLPAKANDAQFLADQERIRKMIDSDAPLGEILSNLVLMIEAQSPDGNERYLTDAATKLAGEAIEHNALK